MGFGRWLVIVFVLLFLLSAGGLIYYQSLKCQKLTVCIDTDTVSVGGAVYKINQDEVNKFASKHKKSALINTVSLWRKPADKLLQEQVGNRPIKINVSTGESGKLIAVRFADPSDKTHFSPQLSVLEHIEGKHIAMSLIVNTSEEDTITEVVMERAFADILYWLITGDGADDDLSADLLQKI